MKNPFSPPTALQVAVRQLESAQRDRLTASEQREYFTAIEVMLQDRIVRLREDIATLMEADNATTNR